MTLSHSRLDFGTKILERMRKDKDDNSSRQWQRHLVECRECFAVVNLQAEAFRSNNGRKQDSLGQLEVKVVRQLGNCSMLPKREFFRQLSNKDETRHGRGWWDGKLCECQ